MLYVLKHSPCSPNSLDWIHICLACHYDPRGPHAYILHHLLPSSFLLPPSYFLIIITFSYTCKYYHMHAFPSSFFLLLPCHYIMLSCAQQWCQCRYTWFFIKEDALSLPLPSLPESRTHGTNVDRELVSNECDDQSDWRRT